MTASTDSIYVIPQHSADGGGKIFLLFPASILVCSLLGCALTGIEGLFSGAISGFVAGIPVTIIASLIFIGKSSARSRAIWEEHTFNWYRHAYPRCAHAQGHVSCRHCGSHRVQAKNLMNRTFMRAHVCNQCGETLYYSREQ